MLLILALKINYSITELLKRCTKYLNNIIYKHIFHVFIFFSVHQENMGDDIIGMAVSGMLATDHDMTPHFTDPGPLPSINTVFMT